MTKKRVTIPERQIQIEDLEGSVVNLKKMVDEWAEIYGDTGSLDYRMWSGEGVIRKNISLSHSQGRVRKPTKSIHCGRRRRKKPESKLRHESGNMMSTN